MKALDKKYRPNGRVVLRTIGEDTLLVPVSGVAAGGRVYPVNATAVAIWNSLSKGLTAHETAQALVQVYSVSEAAALRDVEETAGLFVEEGLLETEG